ncbi:MAG: rhomboid family intramembrane serine protease [Planctomycetota bacterium]
MRMWTVNTWLIVICVLVFVVDSFLPPQFVRMELTPREGMAAELAQLDESVLRYGTPQPLVVNPRTRRVVMAKVPVYWESPGGPRIVADLRVQEMPFLQKYLHFSTARALVSFSSTYGLVGFEFWRFIGFQFLHGGMVHLLFNMIGLFFLGPLVERYLGGKRYLAFYLLCGIFGALLYMVLNLAGYAATLIWGGSVAIPGLLFSSPTTPLIGASAGVFGVIMAGAYLAPNATVLLFFFLPMRLKTLAYVLVVVALWTLITGGQNAGGEAGHLGGALAGFYFIRHPRHLHGFFDVIGRVDPTSHHYRHRRSGRRVTGPGPPGRDVVDRILDKVHREGIRSLSTKEKRILEEASRSDR